MGGWVDEERGNREWGGGRREEGREMRNGKCVVCRVDFKMLELKRRSAKF